MKRTYTDDDFCTVLVTGKQLESIRHAIRISSHFEDEQLDIAYAWTSDVQIIMEALKRYRVIRGSITADEQHEVAEKMRFKMDEEDAR